MLADKGLFIEWARIFFFFNTVTYTHPKLHHNICYQAGPVVTDNGGFILDWFWDKSVALNWADVNSSLANMAGVVETGLFVNMASKAYFGMEDGTVEEVTRDC